MHYNSKLTYLLRWWSFLGIHFCPLWNAISEILHYITLHCITLQDSRDIEDATTALNKVAQENKFLCDKVDTMRREKEELQLRAEQMERESLGMREQGPQAARDEIAARLLAENKRLGAECGRLEALDVNTQPREVPRYANIEHDICSCMTLYCYIIKIYSDRVQDTDPFLALLEGYMHGMYGLYGAVQCMLRVVLTSFPQEARHQMVQVLTTGSCQTMTGRRGMETEAMRAEFLEMATGLS